MMDAYEATRIVFSRIQNLDPENASKIMGLLLIQDHGEKEMIRLAFGPEALVHSVILKARKELGISSNTPSSTPSTPSSPSPFLSNNNPVISLSRQNSSSSSRLGGGGGISLPSPLSIPNQNSSSGSTTSSWAAAASGFLNFQTPEDLISPHNNGISNFSAVNSSSPSMNSASPFYGTELIDEFQLQDQLSFLNEGTKSPEMFYPQQDLVSSPNGNCGGDAMLFPPYGDWGGGSVNGLPHRRSCSVSDICLGSDDSVSGFGWKPCLYYARGYCKNGTSCRFLHGGPTEPAAMVGSPGKLEMMEQCEEILRSKSAHQQQQQQQQQQRLAAASQLMASASFPYSASKCMNFLLQHQQNDTQRAAAALMMGEEMHKFGRSRLDRNHFPMNGTVDMNPGSRQIYLTFPADSTFREEDVSNYFSIYGPVQDVRIPYQPKRMFGFVTFVYPETVKIILAKGNPHFVCDARVLVKPYKEKGKVPDKYRKQQQVERGEYSACNSPTGLDARDPYDLPLGPRMFYNSQDILWRRKLEEQADLQQALELQSRRIMSLQLLDVKKHHHHRALSAGGAPIGSPIQSPSFFNQSPFLHSDRSSSESPPENCSSPAMAFSDQQLQQTVNVVAEKEPTGINENGNSNGNCNGNGNGNESPHNEESDLLESLEHNLPDSPFASPTKAAGEYFSAFSNGAGEAADNNAATNGAISAAASVSNNLITSSLLPATSTLDAASFNSCYFQMPRFSSGHGAIGM